MLKQIAFLLLLLPIGVMGQYEVIDSLNLLLTTQQYDSSRMSLYRQLCTHYRYINQDSSLYFGQLAYDLAEQNKSIEDQAKALRQIGYHYLTASEFQKAQTYSLRAMDLAISTNDTTLMAETSNTVGLAYWKLQDNKKAIEHFQAAYDWAVIGESDRVIRYALNNLGLISSELGRKQEAIVYFEEVGRKSKIANDEEGQVLSLLNIAVIRKDLEEYDQALADFRKGLEILKKGGNQLKIAHTYYYLSEVLRAQGKLAEALRHCNRALEICRSESITDTELLAIATKANILLEQGEYNKAIKQAETGLQVLETQSLPRAYVDFYDILTQAYKGLGDYQEAFGWQEKQVKFSDSIFQVDKEKEIAELEISWASKRKETENKLLRKEQAVKDIVIARRTMVAIVSFILVFLLLIVALLLHRNRRKTKVMNKELEDRVKERTEELENINTQLTHSNDELQRFAYIASHDMKEPIRNVGGFIGLIKKRLTDKKEHELVEYIDFVQQANWQLYDLVENILEFTKINQQNDSGVIHADLNAVVKGVCLLLNHQIRKSKAKIHFKELPTIYFNPAVLKMILKRLVDNAIKYNDQSIPEVWIDFRVEGDNSILSVKDNGIGIAPDFQKKIFDMFTRLHNRGAYSGAGMGLSYCKKLLSNYGATITVESIEGEGSTFSIIIPTKIVYGEQDRTFVSTIKSSITTDN